MSPSSSLSIPSSASPSVVSMGSTSTASNYGHTYSDRIIIHSGEKGEHSLLIFSNLNGSSKITYSQNGGTEVSANVALATVKTDRDEFQSRRRD